ncbi:hypothetical protein EON63_15060 [archaeon]|nr:MAG: hypothetical protein EON63_15060 [archaeon]
MTAAFNVRNKFVLSHKGISTDYELDEQELLFAEKIQPEMLHECYSCWNCCICIPPLCIYSLIVSQWNASHLQKVVEAQNHPVKVAYNYTCCLITAIHVPSDKNKKPLTSISTSSYNEKGTKVQLRAHTAHGVTVDARSVFSEVEIYDINRIEYFMRSQDNSGRKPGAIKNDRMFNELKKEVKNIVEQSASVGRYDTVHYLAKEHPIILIPTLRSAIQKNKAYREQHGPVTTAIEPSTLPVVAAIEPAVVRESFEIVTADDDRPKDSVQNVLHTPDVE